MRRWTFVVLVAALGGAIGWHFAASRRPEPADRQGPAAVAAVPRERADSPPEAPPAKEEDPLGRVLASEFPPLIRDGGQAIRGTVTREDLQLEGDGRPASGVRLVLDPELPEPGPSIRERIEREREREARTRTTTTDLEGRFAFEGLPDDGSYTIRSSPPDLGVRGRRQGIRPGETVDLRADSFFGARKPVAVRITLAGREVPRASLLSGQGEGSELSLRLGVGGIEEWTAAEPEIAAWQGGRRIRAFVDAELASTIATVTGTESAPVSLELEPCSALFGRLELPPTGERASLFALPVEAMKTDGDLRKDGVAVPVSQGAFRLVGAPVGRYLFGVALGQSPVARTWEVDVRDGVNSVTLTLEASPEDDLISITVTGPEGRGMEDIRYFGFKTELTRGTRTESSRPVEAVGHRYRVRLNEAQVDALANGRKASVSVKDGRWGTQEIDLIQGRREYAIAYPPQAELEVVFPDWLGSGLEGTLDVFVRHESEAEDPFSRLRRRDQEPRPDFLGESRFRNLKPGPNVVAVHYTSCDSLGSRAGSVEHGSRTVELAPGPNQIELPLPAVHTVEVAFPPELAGKDLHVSRRGPGGYNSSMQGERRVEGVERLRLPPGEYTVHVEGQSMTFRVDADVRVEFLETTFHAMEVASMGDDSRLQDLGLRVGDRVVAIDGEAIADPSPPRIVWERLKANGRVTLTLVRDGRRLDVPLEQARLPDRWSPPLRPVLDPPPR